MRIVVLRQKGVRVFAAVVVRSAFCAAAALPPWFCILLAPPGFRRRLASSTPRSVLSRMFTLDSGPLAPLPGGAGREGGHWPPVDNELLVRNTF
jgi:hypothetical protein